MGLDPSMTSTSGQRLQVSPPWGASNGRLTREGRIFANKPYSRRACWAIPAVHNKKCRGPCALMGEAEGRLTKQSVLATSLSPGCRIKLFPWQLRPDRTCNGVCPDLGIGLGTHKLIHLRSQHDTSQGSPSQMPPGFSKCSCFPD